MTKKKGKTKNKHTNEKKVKETNGAVNSEELVITDIETSYKIKAQIENEDSAVEQNNSIHETNGKMNGETNGHVTNSITTRPHKKRVSFSLEDEFEVLNAVKETENGSITNVKVNNRNPVRRTLTSVGRFTLLSEVPTNLSIVSSVLLLEKPGLSHEQLMTLLTEKVAKKFYRFRSRVVNYTQFEEVLNFDIEHHIRYEQLNTLEMDIDREQEDELLREKLSSFMNIPLDLNRPLWEVIVIENYSGGFVLFIRAHHCLGDGYVYIQILY
jgi:hypothetical protein